MAFNPNPPKAEYQATAGQTNFPFLFKVFFTSDIKVYHTPVSTGVTVLLTEGVDYSVVINGDEGGAVTLILVVENNDYIVLERELDLNRYVEYQTSGDLLAVTLNADQDYQTYLISDQNTAKDNSLHLVAGTFGVTTEIPAPDADKFFKWNSDGTAVEYGASSSIVVAWGNISGTLSDQTDLQNALDAKADNTSTNWIATNDGVWTGTLSGTTLGAEHITSTGSLNICGLYTWAEDAPGGIYLRQNDNIGIQPMTIHPLSQSLELTSTELTWGGENVVVGNASETNVGGVKVLVSGTDCYITTDGSTPGP